MVPPVELVTTDGYDLQFGTNVLGEKHSNDFGNAPGIDTLMFRPLLLHKAPTSGSHLDR
jgi:hypothetical protein